MGFGSFISVAEDLELAGLLWLPEIGDEVSFRRQPETVSILVDPQGLTPGELRTQFMWLPSVEQLMFQFEARQAVLFHAGLELSESVFLYKTVIKSPVKQIETRAESLRNSLGIALRDLLISSSPNSIN